MKRGFPLYLQILIGMLAGMVVGWTAGMSASPLGEIGKVVIQMIKALAAPLLFFAIVDAFLRAQVRLRSGLKMVGISLTNAVIALTVGLAISNILRPGEYLIPPATHHDANSSPGIDFVKAFTGFIPKSVLEPFLENSVIPLVLLAVLGGLALRAVKVEQGAESVEALVRTLYRAIEIMLGWVIRLLPFAVFGVVAKVVGEQGFEPFKGLGIYVGVAIAGLLFQILVVYQVWIARAARIPLRKFWAGARDPVVYALGASSSLATLPVTLKSLEKMGVSEESSRLAACVGTNLNNDGILLYEAMAVLFVAQAYGIDLTLGQQILAAVSCIVAGFGIAGIPEAGLISLALVLGTVGLPTEILPLLLTVDWILSRARATTNVISDMVVSVVLDRGRFKSSVS